MSKEEFKNGLPVKGIAFGDKDVLGTLENLEGSGNWGIRKEDGTWIAVTVYDKIALV